MLVKIPADGCICLFIHYLSNALINVLLQYCWYSTFQPMLCMLHGKQPPTILCVCIEESRLENKTFVILLHIHIRYCDVCLFLSDVYSTNMNCTQSHLGSLCNTGTPKPCCCSTVYLTTDFPCIRDIKSRNLLGFNWP